MNERQIKALNSLYAATIEVMEAFAPENVRADQRREALSRMIENFLISASYPDQGIVCQSIPQSNYIYSNMDGHKDEVIESVATTSCKVPETNSLPNQVVSDNEEDKRYALFPIAIDNDYCFKRLKFKEDKDDNEIYPYIIILNGDKAVFEVEAPLSVYNEDEIKRIFPERVIEVQAGNVETPSKIVTVSCGELVKDGKSWKVIKRAKVKYE